MLKSRANFSVALEAPRGHDLNELVWRGHSGEKLMKTSLLSIAGIFIVTLALIGCSASNPIVSEWRNPAYGGVSFRRIMVGGLGGETSVRRNFEDEFLAQFRAAGIEAIPSYQYLAEDEKVDETKLRQAAQKAGADAAIFARAINVEQKTQFSPNYYSFPWFGIYGSHGGATWQGPYGTPSVYRYNEYTSETTLYDVVKNEVVWTGTIKTTEPDDVKTAIKAYVKAVIKTLQEKNLLRQSQ